MNTLRILPDELSRVIFDYLNPIHSPPTEYDIWLSLRKYKWCDRCGETLYWLAVCDLCDKPVGIFCSNCEMSYRAPRCRIRRFPTTESDSDYSE